MKPSSLSLYDEEKRFLWRLRTHGAQSRSDLAQALQVSNAAITKLSRSLVSLGLVEEVGSDPTGGRGRPSVPLRVSSAGGYAVGVTVHAGILQIAQVDYAGGIISLDEERIAPPEPREFARLVDQRIHRLAVKHRLLGTRLLGVGVSVPGPALSRDGNRWNIVRSLPGWRNVPLLEIMDTTLGLPVWIENDAAAAALAEYYLGDLIKRCSNAVVLLLGYGIGAGIVSEGRLMRGEVGSSGEIGMLYPNDRPRPTTLDLISTLQAAGSGVTSLADFEAETRNFEKIVAEWEERAAEQLKLAVNSAIAWFDPGAIRLASPLPRSIIQRLADRLNDGSLMWGEHRAESDMGPIEIEASNLGRASATLGAALLPIHASIARG